MNTKDHRFVQPGTRGIRAVLACLACLAIGGCASAPDADARASLASATADSSGPEEIAEAEQAVAIAGLELEKARLERKGGLAEASSAVELSRLKLTEATRALEAFADKSKLERDEAQLDLDRASGRATDAELELSELEAMYSEDEFAEKTKELVLTRGRRNLELARRALALEALALEHLTDVEHPTERAGLERALVEARSELADAESERAVTTLALEIDVEKALAAQHEAERELTKAKAKKDES